MTTRNAPLFAIIAGEISGDRLGAGLMEALRERFPDAGFIGVGGEQMQAQGLESLFPMERLSLMGITEVLPRLPELFRLRRQLLQHLRRQQPDLCITIDIPDFNLSLARRLRRSGLGTVHYVSPTVWAWRQGRVRGIRRSVDLMLTLFPFEAGFYEHHGVPVRCVGHPMADRLPMEPDREGARAALSLPAEAPVLAILPGSRESEVARVLGDFLEAARLLRDRRPELVPCIAAVDRAREEQIRQALTGHPLEPDVRVVTGQSQEVMTAGDLVLLSSGTAALEAMLLKRPMVVGYRVGRISAAIAKLMLRVPWVSMPNLLAGEELVPEFLQNDLRPRALAEALGHWLDHPAEVATLQRRFAAMHRDLQRDASRSAADAIAELLEQAHVKAGSGDH